MLCPIILTFSLLSTTTLFQELIVCVLVTWYLRTQVSEISLPFLNKRNVPGLSTIEFWPFTLPTLPVVSALIQFSLLPHLKYNEVICFGSLLIPFRSLTALSLWWTVWSWITFLWFFVNIHLVKRVFK